MAERWAPPMGSSYLDSSLVALKEGLLVELLVWMTWELWTDYRKVGPMLGALKAPRTWDMRKVGLRWDLWKVILLALQW